MVAGRRRRSNRPIWRLVLLVNQKKKKTFDMNRNRQDAMQPCPTNVRTAILALHIPFQIINAVQHTHTHFNKSFKFSNTTNWKTFFIQTITMSYQYIAATDCHIHYIFTSITSNDLSSTLGSQRLHINSWTYSKLTKQKRRKKKHVERERERKNRIRNWFYRSCQSVAVMFQ